MHCPECEAFPELEFPQTDLYLWLPLDHTHGKIASYLGSSDFEYESAGHQVVKVRLDKADLRKFALEVGSTLTQKELQGSKAMPVPRDRSLDPADLARVVPLDRLVANYHGYWLRQMIEEDRFATWFQPIVLPDGSRRGCEALFRGKERDGSIIMPGPIFRTAQEAGLLFQVDLAARRSAVETAAAAGLKDQWLFINFNPTAVYDPSYCLRTTVSACEALGLDPASIVFEVTETELVEDTRHLRGILTFYRKAGFRVALDDVGAGYSGLNMLQELEPDLIKIDRHLVTDIDSDDFRRNIVEHLVMLSHRQGIKVLAEGVETEAEAEAVSACGVDLMQGYYFGRPAPAL